MGIDLVDKSFIAQAVCFLMPVVLGCIVFSFLNLNTYGFPNYSYDAMGTHYPAKIEGYSPVLPVINTLARMAVGEALYPYWFICLNLALFIIIPYILLFEITKKHRYGIVFLYGTAIPVLGYITCLLGQALMVDLMLLLIARPKWFWGVALVAALSHVFGLVAIVLTKLWIWYDEKEKRIQQFVAIGESKLRHCPSCGLSSLHFYSPGTESEHKREQCACGYVIRRWIERYDV